MSRSIWAIALAVCAVALAGFTAALMPGVALAAGGSSANHSQPQTHRATVLGLGSGLQTPSRAVRSLQTKLTAGGFTPGPVDGRFGPMTKAAVQRFQRADGLAVDGIVGPRTRHGLAAGGLLPGAGSIEPSGSGAVKRLQRRLGRSGFSPGAADGRYGPRTAAAVKRFQHARHLAASGIASAATLRALSSHTRRPALHAASPPKRSPAPAKPKAKHNPTNTNPAPAPAKPAVHKPSSFPWTILLLLVALAIGALAMISLRGRKRGERVPHTQTIAPQVYEPPSGDAAVPAPLEVPASTAPIPAAVSAAAQEPTSSAAQIAELEAAVAMPSAGSPRNNEVQRTLDTPAPLVVDNPEQPEERVERVKSLQRQLTWLGFHAGVVDGRYGPLTTEAVRAFQRVRALPADGVADAATLTALRAGTPDRPFSGRVARVKELQRELTLRGFEPGDIDGRYGPRTTDAVKRFQRDRSLPDDGVADQATLDALHGRKITQPFSRREERVKELQLQLGALGLEPGRIDGRYGPMTTEAVRRFQRAHDLPVDGVADPVTLSALKASVKGSPFIVRTERVKELQRELHRLGLKPGMVDGRYGPLTTQAVTRFQEAHNLAADGIADPETLNRIRQNNPATPEHQLSQTQD
jgi:peptidoglycan hydrolase-like protein with peptidoglycan-binding domain